MEEFEMELLQTKILKPWRNQKGLTLIELLAVIIVLGIILAIAVPSVLGVVNRSKINADKASWQLIKEAGMQYAIANNLQGNETISVSDLSSEGYLNSVPSIQSGKIASWGNVVITVTNGKYSVSVTDGGGNAITDSTFSD
jgi:type IV pilus assembly protein PilA